MTHRLKVKGLKKFHANRNLKYAIIAMLISEKMDFTSKNIKIDKEGHYVMIKGSIQQENITVVNIYALNTIAPRYIKQT